eukprot:UN03068
MNKFIKEQKSKFEYIGCLTFSVAMAKCWNLPGILFLVNMKINRIYRGFCLKMSSDPYVAEAWKEKEKYEVYQWSIRKPTTENYNKAKSELT